MVARVVAIVPPAASKPVTLNLPFVTAVGGPDPSAVSRMRWATPRSSAIASTESSASHTGARYPVVATNVRSNPVEIQVIRSWVAPRASVGSSPTRAFCGEMSRPGWPMNATVVPSLDTDGWV